MKRMTTRTVMAVAIASNFCTAATWSQEVSPARIEAVLAEEKSAIGEVAGLLKEHLSAALKDQGPVAAIGVCQTIAPQTTTNTGDKRELQIKRTALKLRSQANAPDAFERRVLDDFAAKAKAGADLATLSYSQVVERSGKKYLRLMTAIPMVEQPCAVCHGTDVNPEVLEAIRAGYPEDQATGFRPADLRGAFSVTKALD